jgi:hypothetical protein
VRRALVPYLGVLALGVLAAQVLTEAVTPRLLPSWTVLVSGGLYNCFRLWQLRTARRDLAASGADGRGRRAAAVVLGAGVIFWALNLAVLAASAAAVTLTG